MTKIYSAGQRWLLLMALGIGASPMAFGQVPTITAVLPTRNAYAAPTNAPQNITFSQTMSGSPSSVGAVRMFGSVVGGKKAGTASAVTNKLIFNPTVPANAGERISTTVTTAAQSSGGFNLATGQVTQFTAAAGGTGQGFYTYGPSINANVTASILPDIDGDGDLDVVATAASGVVKLYKNLGLGGMIFSADLTQATGSTLVDPQAADLDADGDFDLVIGDQTNGLLRRWINNGAGVFVAGTSVSTGPNQLRFVRVGDFDADGDLDVATAHASAVGQPQLRVFANNGTGTLTALSVLDLNNNNHDLRALEVGDMDNDGDLELVILSSLGFGIGEYVISCQNNGAGTFAYLPPTALYSGSTAMRLVNLDNDNDLDVVAATYGGYCQLKLNNGTGTLTGNQTVQLPSNGNTFDLEVLDVNADGWPDLLSTDSFGWFATDINCALGGPGYTWTVLRNSYISPVLPWQGRVTPGDFDGDGDIDLWGNSTFGMVPFYNEPVMRLIPLAPLTNAANVPLTQLVQVMANQSLDDGPGNQSRMMVFSAQAGGRKANTTQVGVVGQLTPTVAFRPGELVTAVVPATMESVSFAGSLTPPRGLVWQFTTAATGGLGTFTAAPNAATGAAPNGVCTADFNSDGLLDLATANASGASVTVRLGTGGGNYGPANTIALAGTQPRGIAAGDVDNDGDLDLAVTTGLNTPAVSVRFLINAGNATFALGAGLNLPDTPQEPALADVNADGNLDLLTANFFGSASIRLGNGAGAFSGSQYLVAFAPCTSIAVGDVDNDGDLDLVTGSYGGGAVSVRLNDGLGNFSGGSDLTPAGEPRNVALADITADGILDIIVAGDGVERAIGLGSGAFAGFVNLGGAGTQVNDVATGDIDSDGDLDVLASTTAPAQVQVYLNNGFGLSYTPGTPTAVSASVLNLATADLDNDGDIDFLASSTGAGTVNVRLNLNSPPPLPTPPILLSVIPGSHQPFVQLTTNLIFTFDQPMSNAPASVGSPRVFGAETGRRTGAGTVTGNAINFNPTTDFRPGELVSVTMTTNAQATNNFPLNPLLTPNVHQFRAGVGAGVGQFNGGWQQTLSGGSRGAAAADIDGDGDVDGLVVDFGANAVQLYMNPGGTNPFTVGASVPAGTSPNGLTVGDLDGDGDVDLLVANQGSSTVSVCLNNGAGVFGAATAVPVGAGAIAVAVGDLDGDGDLDLATANNGAGASVCFNAGNGTFGAATTVSVGSAPTGISLTDVNNDGDLDLLTSNLSSNDVSVCQNNGAGVFGAATSVAVGLNPTGLTLGDVDNDGDPDLLTADNSANTVSVCLNTAGVFGSATAVAVGFSPRNVVLADADGDGDLDLLATTQNATSTLCLNNGVGTFGPAVGVALPGASYGLASADLDNDGDIDWLSTTFSGGVAVRYNEYADLIISTTMNVPPGPWHNITVTGTGNGTLTGPETVTGNVVVQTGGVWNDGCFTLGGPGTFTLQTGAVLNICHPQGISLTGATGAIQVTGTRSYSATADYEYLQPSLAQITGTGFTGARNLTVNAPTGLSLTSNAGVGRMLTLTSTSGNFTLGGQSLTLLSTATQTAMVVNAGASAVLGNTAFVQRYITPGLAPALGYRHMTAPVSGSTMSDLAVPGVGGFVPYVNPAYNSPIPAPTLPAGQFPRIFGFDETRGGPTNPNFADAWYSPTTLADPLTPGRGFSVYMRPLTPDFKGILGNGNLAMSGLTRTGAFLGGGQKSGWHLLGNPYPAPLDWDNATPGPGPGQIPTGMSGSISVYQSTGGNNGQYLTRVSGVGSLPNGEMAMAQAFFARVTGVGPVNFTFTNALRVTSYSNPIHYRTTTSTRPILSLTLREQNALPGAQSEAYVYFDSAATAGLDNFLDGPVPGHNIGVPTLVSVLPTGDELAINALPLSYLVDPSTVELLADLPAAGSYELALDQWDNLAGADAVLLDRLTATRYDLNQQPTLAFSVAQRGILAGRFALEFGQRPLGTSSLGSQTAPLQVWPNPAHGTVRVTLPTGTSRLEVFDVTGRCVRVVSPEANEVTLTDLSAGLYTLRAGAAVQRLVVE